MIHTDWNELEEDLWEFSWSSVKFRGHTGRKNDDLDPNWAFPDRNSSFYTHIAMKWCTKLEGA